jgi:hypothetical protein
MFVSKNWRKPKSCVAGCVPFEHIILTGMWTQKLVLQVHSLVNYQNHNATFA